MFTTYSGANKVIDNDRKVTYETETIVDENTGAFLYVKIRRRAQSAYHYVGMTEAAAKAAADEIRDSYFRKYARWEVNIGEATGVVTELPVYIYACTSDIQACHTGGDMWQVNVQEEEEDDITSLTELTSVEDLEDYFKVALQREAAYDAIASEQNKIEITSAIYNPARDTVTVTFVHSIEGLGEGSRNVKIDLYVEQDTEGASGSWVELSTTSVTQGNIVFGISENQWPRIEGLAVSARVRLRYVTSGQQDLISEKVSSDLVQVASYKEISGEYVEQIVWHGQGTNSYKDERHPARPQVSGVVRFKIEDGFFAPILKVNTADGTSNSFAVSLYGNKDYVVGGLSATHISGNVYEVAFSVDGSGSNDQGESGLDISLKDRINTQYAMEFSAKLHTHDEKYIRISQIENTLDTLTVTINTNLDAATMNALKHMVCQRWNGERHWDDGNVSASSYTNVGFVGTCSFVDGKWKFISHSFNPGCQNGKGEFYFPEVRYGDSNEFSTCSNVFVYNWTAWGLTETLNLVWDGLPRTNAGAESTVSVTLTTQNNVAAAIDWGDESQIEYVQSGTHTHTYNLKSDEKLNAGTITILGDVTAVTTAITSGATASTKLKDVVFKGSTLTSIAANAFQGHDVTTVTANSVTSIGANAFETSVLDVDASTTSAVFYFKGVTSIGANAFHNHLAKGSIIWLGEGFTSIGNNAFLHCDRNSYNAIDIYAKKSELPIREMSGFPWGLAYGSKIHCGTNYKDTIVIEPPGPTPTT